MGQKWGVVEFHHYGENQLEHTAPFLRELKKVLMPRQCIGHFGAVNLDVLPHNQRIVYGVNF